MLLKSCSFTWTVTFKGLTWRINKIEATTRFVWCDSVTKRNVSTVVLHHNWEIPSLVCSGWIKLPLKWEQLCPQKTSTVPKSLPAVFICNAGWRHIGMMEIWECQKYVDTTCNEWKYLSFRACQYSWFSSISKSFCWFGGKTGTYYTVETWRIPAPRFSNLVDNF